MEELDIKDLVIALWKKKWIIIIVTILFGCFAFWKYGRVNKAQNSTSTTSEVVFDKGVAISFTVGRTNEKRLSGDTLFEVSEKTVVDNNLMATISDVIKSKIVIENTIKNLNLDISETDLKSKINVFRTENSNIIEIILLDYENEKNAKNVLNCIIQETEQQLTKMYNISELIIIDEPYVLDNNGFIIESTNDASESLTAKPKTSSSKKKVVIITGMGFVLSCGVIVIMELFSTSVKTARGLENATNLKTLTTIPKTNLDTSNYFKMLRVNIKECNTILVTGSEDKSGKSFVATNLARSFARLDNKKVLLVDLTKNISELTKAEAKLGISDFIDSTDKLVEKYIIGSNVANLSLLLRGTKESNITELFESEKMKETIETLGKIYDVVIIDSENVIDSANTLAVSKYTKYSLLVVEHRRSKIENIIKSKTNIEDVGGNVIGTVLNKFKN